MFGTGGLLRSLVVTAVDEANRRGQYRGAIGAIQSTGTDRVAALNEQDGLFTLVERGIEDGAPVDRARIIGAITRAYHFRENWTDLCHIAASPDLGVIVSNVTEAGFARGEFTTRLTGLLRARFSAGRNTRLFVIPTELVPDNGPRLRAFVHDEAAAFETRNGFSAWIDEHVTFASSLVDRITTAAPPGEREALAARFGYEDSQVTVTEPAALWAIEGDPGALRAVFPVDDGTRVVFAPDITAFRQRKIRLLNGAHTAFAPVALLAGIATVRAATEHAEAGPFFRRLLFDELVQGSGVEKGEAARYAQSVWERFGNPWIDHAWSVIANNQDEKLRIRVLPSIIEYTRSTGRPPVLLSLALAAHVVYRGLAPDALGDVAPRVREWASMITSNGMIVAIQRAMSEASGTQA
ncbi:MAG TPA: hypothetical protein VE967_15825 [Gemmatimonadaceae bacterium]|nr:hypothetical protein [Gemmatimonadaceae bacterium]